MPPAVPYIAQLQDENTLLICCPYMNQVRPTTFDGPGLCVLKRGAAESKMDDAMSKLSEEERLLRCAQEALEVIPNTKVQEPTQHDSEQEAAEKVMVHVKFQNGVYNLETRYGQDTLQKVLTSAHELKVQPGDYGKALKELHEKMKNAGLLDPNFDQDQPPAAPPPPPPTPVKAAVAAPSKAEEEAAAAPSLKSMPTVQSLAESQEPSSSSSSMAAVAVTVSLAAAVAAFVWYRSRRR